MSESLSSRVGRIVSGSVNALMAAVENSKPEVVLEQAIRELEGALDEVRAELGRELAKKHLASSRLMEENRRHEDLTEKIDLAIKEDREDLAQVAIAQQLDIEAQIPVLERTLAECGDREKELEGFIGALVAKRRQMREELNEFVEGQAKAAAATTAKGKAAPARSKAAARADKATSAFDRVLEANTGVPVASNDTATAAKLAELEDLARQNRIQERIAEARARLVRK